MTLENYKIIHLCGLMFLFFGLGGTLALAYAGGEASKKARSLTFATHGLGLFLILLGGFGMLARLQLIHELPSWVYTKLGIWLALGGAIALAKRKPQMAWTLTMGFVILAATAAYLGITKPA